MNMEKSAKLAIALIRKRGEHAFLKVRVGDLKSMRFFSYIKWAAVDWLEKCPFCLKDVPETLIHMLLYCETWNDIRDRMVFKLQNRLHLDSSIDTRLLIPMEISWALLGGRGVFTIWTQVVETYVSNSYRVSDILAAV
jgi:hypothetical protein